MKITQKGIFAIIVALVVTVCAADDQQTINELCRFRIATILHPNPMLCHLYVKCQFVGNIRECPEGNIFVENEVCVPGNKLTCQRDNKVPTVTADHQDLTSVLSVDGICDNIQMGFFKDPRSCRSFILCIFEIPDFLDCPSHAPVFDANTLLCVAGNPDTCEIFGQNPPSTPPPTTPSPTTPAPTTPSPTTPPPTTPAPTTPSPTTPAPTTPSPTTPPPTIPAPTTPSPTTPPPTIPAPTPPTGTPSPTTQAPPAPLPPFDVCTGNNFLFVADPLTCFRYYFCLFGIPIAGECDSDRIFDERLRGCVLGNQETCTRNRIIDIEIVTNRPN